MTVSHAIRVSPRVQFKVMVEDAGPSWLSRAVLPGEVLARCLRAHSRCEQPTAIVDALRVAAMDCAPLQPDSFWRELVATEDSPGAGLVLQDTELRKPAMLGWLQARAREMRSAVNAQREGARCSGPLRVILVAVRRSLDIRECLKSPGRGAV
jgi:hypothetical protein